MGLPSTIASRLRFSVLDWRAIRSQRGSQERQAAARVPAGAQAAADAARRVALAAHRGRHQQRAQPAAAGIPQPLRPAQVRPAFRHRLICHSE